MSGESSAYGLWWLVLINTAVFIIFAFSFARPGSAHDWRSFGACSTFLVTMYIRLARREQRASVTPGAHDAPGQVDAKC